MRGSILLSAAAYFSVASATVYKGFNYGSTFTDGSAKTQTDFESEFKTAKNLVGTSGFTSARLYTMIQGGTASDPITAIPAAIAQKTSLLLGIWASGGQAGVTNEIAALTAAVKTYGTAFTSLVVGLSVGSEDLYRVSPTGIINKSGVGASPTELVNYIKQVKTALTGTALSGVSIGHVDTWNSWTNSSNNAVIDAIDWLGVDEYPYFQNTENNSIDDAYTLFWAAYAATSAAAGGKPVWITETGWPVAGKTENLAVASLANAKTFWDQVGCASAFDKINTWWYVLQDAAPTAPVPSFGLVGSSTSDSTLSTTPLYDLSCTNVTLPSSSSSSSTASASASKASSSASAVATGSTTSTGSGSGTGTGTTKAATTTATGTTSGGTGGSTSGTTTGVSQSSSTSVRSSSVSAVSASATGGASTIMVSTWFFGSVLFAIAAVY